MSTPVVFWYSPPFRQGGVWGRPDCTMPGWVTKSCAGEYVIRKSGHYLVQEKGEQGERGKEEKEEEKKIGRTYTPKKTMARATYDSWNHTKKGFTRGKGERKELRRTNISPSDRSPLVGDRQPGSPYVANTCLFRRGHVWRPFPLGRSSHLFPRPHHGGLHEKLRTREAHAAARTIFPRTLDDG